jgi:hypothetical protein
MRSSGFRVLANCSAAAAAFRIICSGLIALATWRTGPGTKVVFPSLVSTVRVRELAISYRPITLSPKLVAAS